MARAPSTIGNTGPASADRNIPFLLGVGRRLLHPIFPAMFSLGIAKKKIREKRLTGRIRRLIFTPNFIEWLLSGVMTVKPSTIHLSQPGYRASREGYQCADRLGFGMPGEGST